MNRQKLTLRNRKPTKTMLQYIHDLDPERRKVFFSDLMNIAIAYFTGVNWQLTKIRISNNYPDELYEGLRTKILDMDEEIIHRITDDFINFYQAKGITNGST